MKLAAVILTKNEAIHLRRAIASVKRKVDFVYVVDCFSDDQTAEIAELEGAIVLQRKWDSYPGQLNWALEKIKNHADWILRIDADEFLLPDTDLRLEISRKLNSNSSVRGIYCLRSVVYMNKKLKFGGMSKKNVLRLFAAQEVRCSERLVDEHILVNGKVLSSNIEIIDHCLKGHEFWAKKHREYATLEAEQYFVSYRKYKSCRNKSSVTSIQNKNYRIYYLLPPFLRAVLYFIFRYFVQRGFLDGYAGFLFAFRQALWYRFLVDIKISKNIFLDKTKICFKKI